jgi:hypothetical protein
MILNTGGRVMDRKIFSNTVVFLVKLRNPPALQVVM